MIQCKTCGLWYDGTTTGHICQSYPTYYPTYQYPFIDNLALQRIAAALEKLAGMTPDNAKTDKNNAGG